MRRSNVWWLMLIAGLAITACAYWPGLSGGYFFDDFPNIVDNKDIHVSTLDLQDWRIAAQASPSAELRRPLAMLSYAANYYFTGLDPFPMKLTNLVIHLLNGVLLWKVLADLLRQWRIGRPAELSEDAAQLTASAIACAWLLLPINLSSVLYVVQRMESLAQTFVLAGLWVYLAGRKRILAGNGRGGLAACTAGIVLGCGFGLLCKESAVLLPLYAFMMELFLLRFQAPKTAGRRGLLALFGITLFVPGIVGLAWLLPHVASAAAYAGRPFTLHQRLLTEARVLVDYAVWTFTPDAGVQSFYHDDLPVSRGWLDPPSTLVCAALLAASLAAAALLRRQLPLLALGICWYLAAHLLTATVIPLELVFEHRNYCASIGLLLAAAALLQHLSRFSARLAVVAPALLVAALAITTGLRAEEWSDPLRLAYSEALKHPLSPRANYELGQTLTVASGYRQDSHLIEPALDAFDHASRLPNSGASPLAAMIVVAGHMHQPARPDWWNRLAGALAAQPPSAESISALESLVHCQRRGECPTETQPLLNAFLAALDHPAPSARLLAVYGGFAANALGDYAAAERALADAVMQMPTAAEVRMDLVAVLILQGQSGRARAELDQLRHGSLGSAETARFNRLEDALRAGATSGTPGR